MMLSFMILDLEIAKNSEQFNLKGKVMSTRSATIATYLFSVGKYQCFHHSGTALKLRGNKQVLKHGLQVPEGFYRTVLFIILQGWDMNVCALSLKAMDRVVSVVEGLACV